MKKEIIKLINHWNKMIPIKLKEESNPKLLTQSEIDFILENISIFYTYSSSKMKLALSELKKDI